MYGVFENYPRHSLSTRLISLPISRTRCPRPRGVTALLDELQLRPTHQTLTQANGDRKTTPGDGRRAGDPGLDVPRHRSDARLTETSREERALQRPHDKMPVVGTDQTSPHAPGQAPLDNLRALVVSAFEAAKESGRADWEVMTTAVLKNRILLATAREFDEHDYGATSFTEAIRQIPDLVELDETTRPPRARLIAPGDANGAEAQEGDSRPAIAAGRVRNDLWDAVLDYSSAGVYVWDGSRAVRVEADEVGDRPRLPTISSEDMAAWRQAFASEHADRQLDDWAERGLGTLALPADIRGPWNQVIKSNVLGILSAWFDKQGLELPADTLASSASKRPSSDHIEAEELRRFLLRCVAVMKPSELQAVQIPASVAFRARA